MKYQLDKTYTDKDVVCITMHAMLAIKPKLVYSGKDPEILKAIENLTDTLKRRANPSFMEVPCCTDPAIRAMYESACMRGKDQLKNFISSEVMKSALNWESILGSDASILDSETDKVLDILKEKISYESLSDEVRNAIDSAFTDIHVSTEYAVVSVAPAKNYLFLKRTLKISFILMIGKNSKHTITSHVIPRKKSNHEIKGGFI